jgi:hypothetical protein
MLPFGGFASTAEAYCRSTTCKGGDCLRDADGCKTTGEKLFWKSGCVGFSIQKDGTVNIPTKYVRQTIETSFVTWSELACESGVASIAFSLADDAVCKKTEYNDGGANANIILFQDTKWDYKGVDNTLAKTTVSFDPDTGEILDADIEVNHAFNDFSISDENVQYDLQSVLTHEIGHFIGIDHTLDETATMFAGYERGDIEPRSLEVDDVDAACAIYAPGRDAACNTKPKGGFSAECSDAQVEDGGAEEGCAFVGRSPARGTLAVLFALVSLSWIMRRSHRAHSNRTTELG